MGSPRGTDKTSALRIPFVAALTATLLLPAIATDLPFHYFCPLMALAFYRARLITCLRLALACGLVMDLIASHHHLGIYSIAYCGTTAVLYRYKGHLFEDNVTTLPIMTLLFSALSTSLAGALYTAFEEPFTYSWRWVVSEVAIMPLLDGLLALSCVATLAVLRRNKPIKAEDMVADPVASRPK